MDNAGNVYVAMPPNQIRKIASAGAVSTLAGLAGTGSTDASGNLARFSDRRGRHDRVVYVVDTATTRSGGSLAGVVSTLAGWQALAARTAPQRSAFQ